mmetsp:Transcript_9243/g.17010  ORF Transcript_9243/g.17010 Transcript_9243/m.17010 type:complete len:220 (+) Transcript_9243:1582-2241(+)
MVTQKTDEGHGLEDHDVVGQHDCFRFSCCTGRVHQDSTMSGLYGAAAGIDCCIVLLGTHVHQRRPAEDWHCSQTRDIHSVLRWLIAIGDESLDLWRHGILPCHQGRDQPVKLGLVFEDHDAGATVDHLEGCRFRGVRGIETPDLSTCESRGQSADDPLGGIEAPDGHSFKGLQAQLHKAFGCLPGILVVLAVGPGLPFMSWQGRRRSGSFQGGQRPFGL